MKTLPLLLALAAACAHADALFTDPVANKNGFAWLNTETRAATTLTLTRNPDGGDTIAVIPAGGSITALLRDADGHVLGKTPFGITGWAKTAAKPSLPSRYATTNVSALIFTITRNSVAR